MGENAHLSVDLIKIGLLKLSPHLYKSRGSKMEFEVGDLAKYSYHNILCLRSQYRFCHDSCVPTSVCK